MGFAETTVFYLLSFFAIFCAIRSIFSKNNITAAANMFVLFICVGLLFFVLEVPFLGVAQILVCAVALTVLFLVLIAFTDKKDEQNSEKNIPFNKFLVSMTVVILLIFFTCIFIKYGVFLSEGLSASSIMPSVKDISLEVFVRYSIPVIFLGLFFPAAILGIGVLMFDVRKGKNK